MSSKIEAGGSGETSFQFEELIEFLENEKTDQLDLLEQFRSSPSQGWMADDCVKSLARVDQFIKNLQHVLSFDNVDEGIDFFLSKCDPKAFGDCFFEEEEQYHNAMFCYAKLLWHLLARGNPGSPSL